MNFDPQVAKTLEAVIAELQDVSPEITDILDKAKSGDMDPAEAMKNLMEAVGSDPDLTKKFQDIMFRQMATLRDANSPVPPTMFANRGGKGLPQMNPLVTAALVERAQFDDDMPELRTGPMHPNAMPAVPVQTMARNPVAIGAMLKTASTRRKEELEASMAERRRLIQGQLAANPDALAVMQRHGDLMVQQDIGAALAGTADTDPEGYRRGELPTAMKVRRPTGASLATMSDAERHEMAWRFLSTTAGRRSAIEVIRGLVKDFLSKHMEVIEMDFDPKAPRVQPLAYAEWTVALEGKGATQPAFSLVDVSAKVLGTRLLAGLDGNFPAQVVLEVESVNQIADREVGWMARLMPVS